MDSSSLNGGEAGEKGFMSGQAGLTSARQRNKQRRVPGTTSADPSRNAAGTGQQCSMKGSGTISSSGGATPAAAGADAEDKAIQQLTEAVLYDFLPAALNVMLPHSDDPLQELDANKCRAVAGAALVVAALLNAPPGFLEFLLNVPWKKLTQLYPKPDTIDKLISNLHVSPEERRRLVNMRLESSLMRVVLDFLYKPDHIHRLPPILRLTDASTDRAVDLLNTEDTGPIVTLETVAAVLDGATPLHCAALRANPAQVDHLVFCGANPSARTAAGELPLQLVPACGGSSKSKHTTSCSCCGGATTVTTRVCRCGGQCDQDKQQVECKSHATRCILAQRCASSPGILGIFTWLHLLLLSVLCLLGWWGNYTTICRPVIEQHVLTRRERKRQGMRMRAQSLIARMRSEAKQGHAHLAAAKAEAAAQSSLRDATGWRMYRIHVTGKGAGPDGVPDRIDLLLFGQKHAQASSSHNTHATASADPSIRSSSNGSSANLLDSTQQQRHSEGKPQGLSASQQRLVDLAGLFPRPLGNALSTAGSASAPTTIHDINVHLKESVAVNHQGEEQPSELAFKCFVRAVHSLQSLDMQGETIPHVLNDLGDVDSLATSSMHVLEDEQAQLYCCWAESVSLKFGRTCTCPGCAALAVQAVRMAHAQTGKLFQRAEAKHSEVAPELVGSVGMSLARVVHVYMALLLDSEIQASPTRAAVWRAEQCLKEWDRLTARGLTSGFTQEDLAQVAFLRTWARTADADLYIAEALLGGGLSHTHSVQDVLTATITTTDQGLPCLIRPPSPEIVQQVEQVVTLSCGASPSLVAIARQVGASAAEELSLGARLREIMAAVKTPGPEETADCVLSLMETLSAAEAYPRLSGELSICRGILAKWTARADAVGKLISVMDDVRTFTDTHPLLGAANSAGQHHASSLALTNSHSVPGATNSGSSHATGLGRAPSDPAVSPHNPAATTSYSTSGGGNAGSTNNTSKGRSKSAVAVVVPDTSSNLTKRNSQPSHTQLPVAHVDAHSSAKHIAADAEFSAWDEKLKLLDTAIQEAKDATIGVAKAKRLLKELQAQVTAARAASELESVLARKPAGAGALKAGLAKAESATSALSSMGLTTCPAGQAIQTLVTSAKRRLDMERALDVLSKAATSCKAVSDLPRLEAAIINARKVGGDELDPAVYKTASDQRAKLHDASRARSTLEAAQKSGQIAPRPEHADSLERAIQEASKWEDLLSNDLHKAKDVLQGWRAIITSEAKLSKVLAEGTSTSALSRAIADAAAAGVKVSTARRILKLLQGVEQALTATPGEGPATMLATLRSRVEAAEQGSVPSTHPVMITAQETLKRLSTADARNALESALKQASEVRTFERLQLVRAALEKAEEVVGSAAIASVCQDQPPSPLHQNTKDLSLVTPAPPARFDSSRKSVDISTSVLSQKELSKSDGGLISGKVATVQPTNVNSKALRSARSVGVTKSGAATVIATDLKGAVGDETRNSAGGRLETHDSATSNNNSGHDGDDTEDDASSPSDLLLSDVHSGVGQIKTAPDATASSTQLRMLRDQQLDRPPSPIGAVRISDADADMAMLLALARRASVLLSEEQKEHARLEAERAAADKERRDRQEKERAERAKADQERKQREVDAAKRLSDSKATSDKPPGRLQATTKQGKSGKVRVDLASISGQSTQQHAAGGDDADGVGGGKKSARSAYFPPPPPPPHATAAGGSAAAAYNNRKDYKSAAETGVLPVRRSVTPAPSGNTQLATPRTLSLSSAASSNDGGLPAVVPGTCTAPEALSSHMLSSSSSILSTAAGSAAAIPGGVFPSTLPPVSTTPVMTSRLAGLRTSSVGKPGTPQARASPSLSPTAPAFYPVSQSCGVFSPTRTASLNAGSMLAHASSVTPTTSTPAGLGNIFSPAITATSAPLDSPRLTESASSPVLSNANAATRQAVERAWSVHDPLRSHPTHAPSGLGLVHNAVNSLTPLDLHLDARHNTQISASALSGHQDWSLQGTGLIFNSTRSGLASLHPSWQGLPADLHNYTMSSPADVSDGTALPAQLNLESLWRNHGSPHNVLATRDALAANQAVNMDGGGSNQAWQSSLGLQQHLALSYDTAGGRQPPLIWHSRGDSLECLGDPSSKLDPGMLAALDLIYERPEPPAPNATADVMDPSARRQAGSMQEHHSGAGRDNVMYVKECDKDGVELHGNDSIQGSQKSTVVSVVAGGQELSSCADGTRSSMADGSGDAAADLAPTANMVCCAVSQRSSLFGSATSTEDVLLQQACKAASQGGSGGVNDGEAGPSGGAVSVAGSAAGDQQHGSVVFAKTSAVSADATARDTDNITSGSTGITGSGTVSNSAPGLKPKLGIVDLGGLSWGVTDRGNTSLAVATPPDGATVSTEAILLNPATASAGNAAAPGGSQHQHHAVGALPGGMSAATMAEFRSILNSGNALGLGQDVFTDAPGGLYWPQDGHYSSHGNVRAVGGSLSARSSSMWADGASPILAINLHGSVSQAQQQPSLSRSGAFQMPPGPHTQLPSSILRDSLQSAQVILSNTGGSNAFTSAGADMLGGAAGSSFSYIGQQPQASSLYASPRLVVPQALRAQQQAMLAGLPAIRSPTATYTNTSGAQQQQHQQSGPAKYIIEQQRLKQHMQAHGVTLHPNAPVFVPPSTNSNTTGNAAQSQAQDSRPSAGVMNILMRHAQSSVGASGGNARTGLSLDGTGGGLQNLPYTTSTAQLGWSGHVAGAAARAELQSVGLLTSMGADGNATSAGMDASSMDLSKWCQQVSTSQQQHMHHQQQQGSTHADALIAAAQKSALLAAVQREANAAMQQEQQQQGAQDQRGPGAHVLYQKPQEPVLPDDLS